MQAVGFEPIDLALRASDRIGGEPAADAVAGRAVSAEAVLRLATDAALARRAGRACESQTRAAVDAEDGFGGHLSQAADHATPRAAPDFPVLATWRGDCANQPGVEYGHHVCAVASGI